MRESRTYGSVRGACDETHVPTATEAREGGIAMKLPRLSLRATPSSTCLKTACLLLPAIVLAGACGLNRRIIRTRRYGSFRTRHRAAP